jgi:hypothetical protein
MRKETQTVRGGESERQNRNGENGLCGEGESERQNKE